MDRMRRRARFVNPVEPEGVVWKHRAHAPKIYREPDPESRKALPPADPPAPISLGTGSAIITFVIIIGATILLLIVARQFLF